MLGVLPFGSGVGAPQPAISVPGWKVKVYACRGGGGPGGLGGAGGEGGGGEGGGGSGGGGGGDG